MRPFPALVSSQASLAEQVLPSCSEKAQVQGRLTQLGQLEGWSPDRIADQTHAIYSRVPGPAPFLLQGAASCNIWHLPLLTAPPHPKVLDQDTDAIAVHVVRVLTCIMSGSPSAKVRMPP